MYDPYYLQGRNQQDSIISRLQKAINGEYSAVLCYEKLAGLSRNEEERKQILEIREDEIKHFHRFSEIYTSLTGMQPQPQVTEACPNSYLKGLEFAIKDEQETVDFYLETADMTPDPSIRKAFRRAAADEQNHAVWFLYFYVHHK